MGSTSESIDPNRPTIVEVWSPTCADCRAMQADLDAVAARHPDVALVVVDASTEAAWAREWGVLATPTLLGLRDGEEVFRHAGRRSAAELEELFAGLESGRRPSGIGRTDTALQLVAGAVLVAVGVATGPAWVLVGVGIALLGMATYRWARRR